MTSTVTTAHAVRTAAFARDNVTFDYTYNSKTYTVNAVTLEAPTNENTKSGTVVATDAVYGYRTYQLAKITNLIVHTKH
jgi:hypothetical protein